MILKLMDGTEFALTHEQGQQIKRLVETKAEFIYLPDGSMVKVSVIASLKPGLTIGQIAEKNRLAEGTRVATDEGIRQAKERLHEKLTALQRKREAETVREIMSQPVRHNVPKLFDKKKGSVPGWDELYGEIAK